MCILVFIYCIHCTMLLIAVLCYHYSHSSAPALNATTLLYTRWAEERDTQVFFSKSIEFKLEIWGSVRLVAKMRTWCWHNCLKTWIKAWRFMYWVFALKGLIACLLVLEERSLLRCFFRGFFHFFPIKLFYEGAFPYAKWGSKDRRWCITVQIVKPLEENLWFVRHWAI